MKTKNIYHKIKLDSFLTIAIILTGIIASMLIAHHILNIKSSYPSVNNARIVTEMSQSYIANNFYKRNFNKLNKLEFKTQILDISGKILFNNYNSKSGSIDIASSVDYDMNFSSLNKNTVKYSSPIVLNGTQVGTSIFYINKNSVIPSNLSRDIFIIFLPCLLSLLIITAKLVYNIHAAKSEFINPISELNRSADAIIRGNFNKKIEYNSSTEIGKLCASFEMMRDELKDSIEREKRLENSRKELITCISHDLRTPIASIKAYVDGIMDGIAKDKDTVFKYMSVIDKKTQVLTKLINDLFEHCQIELNKLSIKKKEIYSREFLNHISSELSLEFKNSNQQFEVTSMPDVLINIDNLRIEQVIFNLIQNARKYTPDDGKITFGAEIEDDYLKIFVKDNGYGIDTTDIPFIFDKFYRGEKMRNSDKGGSGLGLSICKYVVESHGGQIFVESNSNGSMFYFVLPKA